MRICILQIITQIFNCLTQALQQGLVEHTFGLKQLFPVFALTGLKFVFPALVAFEMPVTIKELNTLTLIYDAYYDFGLIGVFLLYKTPLVFLFDYQGICITILILGTLLYALINYQIITYVFDMVRTSKLYEEHYVDPQNVELEFKEKKKFNSYLFRICRKYVSF